MKILLVITIFAATAWAADPWPNRIPDNLALCYVNKTISDRFRRMPASMENLVALIRKVEAHPDTALWPIGKMASTLIHRFRYDGIVDIPGAGPDVVPVVNERAESDKYRLQWKLVPGTASDFPESSLTMEEKCSLHWMLSYTVNHTANVETRSSGARSIVANVPAQPESDSNVDEEHNHSQSNEEPEPEVPVEHFEHEDEHVEHEQDEDVPPEIVEEHVEHEHEEDVPPEILEENVEPEEDTMRETDDFETLPENTNEETEGVSLDDNGETGMGDYGVGDENNDGESDNPWKRKRRQTETLAAQPMEVGIVHTKYGTVAAGNVLIGVAAGSEPQSAPLKDLIKDPQMELSPGSLERIVHSIWVATLAGDIAQTSLLRTPKGIPSFGPRGKWNCTLCPREYKLETREHSMLTNAEFYGGVDGLLMAQRMATWDSSSYLKLSAVLEMYYSETGIHGDTKYRACNRLYNYRDPAIVDQAMLKEQSLNAALVMYSRGIDGAPTVIPGVKPADQIGRYVNTTMNEIYSFVDGYLSTSNTVDFTQCKGAYTQPIAEPTPATYTDLTFVVDQITDSASIYSQKDLAAALALALDVQLGGSRMEVVSSKDGTPFLDLNSTRNQAELACNIIGLPIGYSERRVADTLDRTRTRILSERSSEKANKIGGTNKRSILFFLSTSISMEKDRIKSVLLKMLGEMPDVHIMFATLGSPEELRPFVSNFDRDIIRMGQFTKYHEAAPEIAKRLTTVGARLSYPECKDISISSNSTEAKYVYTGYLNAYTVQYFRLGPEHFYSSNELYLRFKSMYGLARFCVSSTKERPGAGDNCKTALKAGDTVEFKFMQPCGKMVPDQCSNIYISAAPTSIDDDVPCAEKECHTPDQVKFTFSHSGMRCNSAVAGAVLSQLTLALAALMTWFLNR